MNKTAKPLKILPGINDIVSVYAVISFMIQAWAIQLLLQHLSAWSNYLSAPEILSVIAYRIAESFIECLLLLGMLLLVSLILPARFFRDVFVVRGSAFAVGFLGSVILFWKRFGSDPGLVLANYVPFWTGGTLVLAGLFSLLSVKMEAVADFLDWISERLTVFLYLFVPISLLSLVTVLLRNMR